MPRGVAIPKLREQLFGAAERLLGRDGPGGLSSRAITTEAGVAKGVLHNHFTDLDGFLAEFVMAQFRAAVRDVEDLPTRAGQATVRDNLTKAAAALLESNVHAAHSILIARPSLITRLHQAGDPHSANRLTELEHLVTAYLDAEQELGRIAANADTKAISTALVATVRHTVMARHMNKAAAHEILTRVLDALLAATYPPSETRETSCSTTT